MAYGWLWPIFFREYANEDIDISKVILMCLIHDVVEIEAGDTYAYDEEAKKSQREREEIAKKHIFGMLPSDQGEELEALFDEFEAQETAEARFAKAMDNLQPVLLHEAMVARTGRNTKSPKSKSCVGKRRRDMAQRNYLRLSKI